MRVKEEWVNEATRPAGPLDPTGAGMYWLASNQPPPKVVS
jgi:hypothetical protein